MRAHYLQHVPFEGLGSIEAWLREKGYEISCTRFFASETLPCPTDVDLVIVLGGPMSANNEEKFPWLISEKEFLRRCMDSGKPVVGICLGAQLIAMAMGARVYRNRHKEIGWFPVEGVPSSHSASFRFPAVFEAFHWHGETFDLPAAGVCLARNEGCANQAFQLGLRVIGLQFHLETTPETVQEMLAHCRGELLPSRYVQSEAVILGATPRYYRAANDLMARVLSYVTGTGD